MNSLFNIRPSIDMNEEMDKLEAMTTAKLFRVPAISNDPISFKDVIDNVIVFWKYRGTAFNHDEFLNIRNIETAKPYSEAAIYAHLQLYYVLIKSLIANIAFDTNTITAGVYKANEQIMKDIILHIEAILEAQSIEIVQRKGYDLYDFVLISDMK